MGPPCREPGVVLLDSDADFREALAANLREDGHRVDDHAAIPVPGGFPGIEALLSRLDGPWVLVTTPQILGPRPVELIARAGQAPLVLLDLYASRELERLAARNPTLAVASKPADYDHLHELIHRVAGIPRPRGGSLSGGPPLLRRP